MLQAASNEKFMDPINKKQVLIGTVVSDKMDKTVVVKVDRKKRHAKYKKTYTVSKKFKAHSPENLYHVGDVVEIESIKPMSKEKKFIVLKKI
jgi:small subunit ribosomal protein S17